MDEARFRETLSNARVRPPAPFTVTGDDPIFPARYRVGEAAAVAHGLAASAAAALYEQHTGRAQSVSVDVGLGAATMVSHEYERIDDEPVPQPWWVVAPTNGLFRCAGGDWIYLQGQLPHLHEGILELLGCAGDIPSIAASVSTWDSFELEDALAERTLCGARARTPEEWSAHPQGSYLDPLPVVEVSRIGDAEPEPLALRERPLDGVRVLEFARILAGPMTGRTLAEHGADVLNVSAPALEDLFMTMLVTGRGKRSAYLDLDVPEQAARVHELANSCDVVVDGFRSGALSRRGIGPEDLARTRPGIVYVSVNCYGSGGPWQERRGWEQLAQMVSGLAIGQGAEAQPEIVPPGAPDDFITGILAAYGAMVGLSRRAAEGGSWHVKASLTQTAMWIVRNGVIDPSAPTGVHIGPEHLTHTSGTLGRLTHLASPVRMSLTPTRWDRPSPRRGADEPVWLARDLHA